MSGNKGKIHQLPDHKSIFQLKVFEQPICENYYYTPTTLSHNVKKVDDLVSIIEAET
ncbi:MAG: hypothetical protein R2685_10290 [Candidatus Nitrosocosmicus sp.]|jgi:hypothetical protein|nr:hypothetical protein [Candidatus Nitrosocosmicus sp.]